MGVERVREPFGNLPFYSLSDEGIGRGKGEDGMITYQERGKARIAIDLEAAKGIAYSLGFDHVLGWVLRERGQEIVVMRGSVFNPNFKSLKWEDGDDEAQEIYAELKKGIGAAYFLLNKVI